jgi:hypothetical protein
MKYGVAMCLRPLSGDGTGAGSAVCMTVKFSTNSGYRHSPVSPIFIYAIADLGNFKKKIEKLK